MVTVEVVATPTPEPETGPSASRSFSASTIDGGEELVVTIDVANYGGFGAVVETLPEGFTYVPMSSDLDAAQVKENGQEITFALLGETTVTYRVTSADDPDTYDFSGVLHDENSMEHEVSGTLSVTVRGPEPLTPTTRRSFTQASVVAGQELEVTISATGYGRLGAVVETLPEGFTYVPMSSDLDAAQVRVNGQKITFALLGESSFTYRVTSADDPDTYDFSGVLHDENSMEHAVGGASSVRVTAPQPLRPTVSRSFASTSVGAGEELVVTIAVANYGRFGAVEETLPEGFTYVPMSSSLGDERVQENGQTVVRFALVDETSFTYNVTAASTAGTYNFSGVLHDENRMEHEVRGASSVRVVGPGATRSLPATAAPGSQIVVTIRATSYDAFGAVTETLPEGFIYVESNLPDEEVDEIDARTVRFVLSGGNASFTYTVTAPAATGSYTFTGTLRDSRQTRPHDR